MDAATQQPAEIEHADQRLGVDLPQRLRGAPIAVKEVALDTQSYNFV